jgi:3-phosphoshikimate 1-carboxyvinyltransferase
MNCEIEKTKISGKLVCPPNKSYSHRAIFLASLANGNSVIKNILHSADTEATIHACEKFGAKINEEDNNLIVNSNSVIQSCSIDAANSGTTIRISSAIASLVAGKTTLSGDESLNQRPMQALLDALESIGSSQFISALMIVAPLSENGIVLNIKGDLVSKPYLASTISMMDKFGVTVKTDTPFKKYSITPQKYVPTSITIPSDFSSLALLLSAAVLIGDNLQIQTTTSDLPQGDEAFIDILKKLGVVVNLSENISVKTPEKLVGGKFDLGDTPDLLPPLSILALKTSKPIEIFNVKHARYKETDRISVLARELRKLGIQVEEKEDVLILSSPVDPKSANLNSENDHRLFMAFCIAGMYVGNCSVSDPDSVNVSYPNFIKDLNQAGGKIKIST